MTTPLDVDIDAAIGVVGSPSSTARLTVEVLENAATRSLTGEMVWFRFEQDGVDHVALGQVTRLSMRNRWHEDPTILTLIRRHAHIDAVSGRQDTHTAELALGAVFRHEGDGRWRGTRLGTVPRTGTLLYPVSDAVLGHLLASAGDELFHLGTVYGATPRLPMWFRHFGPGPGGAGEAFHVGVFGRTGSGKSVLARMMLVAWGRHRDMPILVLDPQGEFARELRRDADRPVGGFDLDLRGVLEGLGRQNIVVRRIDELVLDSWELFERLLADSPFFPRLTIKRAENADIAMDILIHTLEKHEKLADLHRRDVFDRVLTFLASPDVLDAAFATRAPRERVRQVIGNADRDVLYAEHWKPVAALFAEDEHRRPVKRAVEWLVGGKGRDGQPDAGRVLVLDLSAEAAGRAGLAWSEHTEAVVIHHILKSLQEVAEKTWQEGGSINTLVLIDEAHRLAPRWPPEDEAARAVRLALVDAVRTTRKYGLGWMFISQTLSSLHPELLHQLRMMFFGFGLAMGAEWQALTQIAGGAEGALDLYRSFADPQSALDARGRRFPFMAVGPVSPLSFSGRPVFFEAFNRAGAFLEANGLAPPRS